MISKGVVSAPLTWLDVERMLKKSTSLWRNLPAGVHSIDCFADGMDIRHSATAADVDAWMSTVFGAIYDAAKRSIRLRIPGTIYPVQFLEEYSNEPEKSIQVYPLWEDVTYLPSDFSGEPVGPGQSGPDCPPNWSDGPEMVSFHSFKGGVGRTTALMTYVTSCMQEAGNRAKKILVIDADLEAPGVSFWLDETNRPTVSFVNLLEALHYPPATTEESLTFFADELRKTSLNISGMQQQLFILPAALDFDQIQDMPVAPQQFARNPANPWRLSDCLRNLGELLNADAVFIDLRAGLSELASPILFDPRIDHFFVSTVARQSISGMAEVLRRLHAFNRQLPESLWVEVRPTVILSMLTKELREGADYEEALRSLDEAYPSDDELVQGIQWVEAEFLSTLMSIGTIREAIDTLPQSNKLYANARDWAAALYSAAEPRSVDQTDTLPLSTRQAKASSMHSICQRAQFAESDAAAEILATEPLLNLGKYHAKELPNLLMVGAKGAGKTFTFRQLIRTNQWSHFLAKIGFDASHNIDASIFPALWSSNLEDNPGGEIKISQKKVLERIGADTGSLLKSSTLSQRIKDQLATPDGSWEAFWDGLISGQLGFPLGDLTALNDALVHKSQRIIFAFDGIEDAFEDATTPASADAIQALLRLPNRLSELENRHVGAIIFVRADYVQAVIKQNLGQFLQRFQPFRLQWNPESFLRLAFMLSCSAGIIDGDPKSAERLRVDQLKVDLERLWGKKLGSERSKEAYSARWVYAALCDLKGNVQARDLVRFLKFASDLESNRQASSWPDRILSPEAMRKAIQPCSREKVDEAKAEIAPLKAWTRLLDEHPTQIKKVPFSKEDVYLTSDLLSALQEIGVIYEDLDGKLGEERLFLPEIYRSGLGFETSAAGRPRMQALLKKNIGNIPL